MEDISKVVCDNVGNMDILFAAVQTNVNIIQRFQSQILHFILDHSQRFKHRKMKK